MEKKKDLELMYLKIMIVIPVIGKTIKCTVWEYINIKISIKIKNMFILVNFLNLNFMELEN
jgi:hypothetical protein